MPDEKGGKLRRGGRVRQLVRVKVAANLHSLKRIRVDGPLQFFNVVRRNRFAGGTGSQRPGQVETFGRATGCLVKVVFFLQQGVSGNVFQKNTVFLQTHSFFVRIQPVARRSERKAAFDQAGDKDRPKPEAAHVRGFQNF